MHAPTNMTRIINRKKYSTKTATLLAGDDYWDGNNFERHGRNTFLYKTAKNNYFIVTLTKWQGEQDSLQPITLDEAIEYFEQRLTEHEVKYSEAFPGVEVEEA